MILVSVGGRKRLRRYDPNSSEVNVRKRIQRCGNDWFEGWDRYVQRVCRLQNEIIGGGDLKIVGESDFKRLDWDREGTEFEDVKKAYRKERRMVWVERRKKEEAIWRERIRKEREMRIKMEKERREREERERKQREERERERRRREEEERVKREEEKKKAEEELRKQRMEEEKQRIEKERKEKEIQRAMKTKVSVDMPPDIMKCIAQRKQAIELGRSFYESRDAKQQRTSLRKHINIATNQISLSQKSVNEKINELISVLQEASQLGSSAQAWAAMRVVERLVSAGESTVAVSSAAAFSVGYVIDGLIKRAPLLADLFLAEFCLACPFCAPLYPVKKPTETKQQYLFRLGFKEGEEGDGYLERMSGYVALYSALLQMGTFGESRAWDWFKKMVEGRAAKMSAPVLATFLEVAGYEMAKFYGAKFGELLQVMMNRMGPGKIKGARPGAASRLQKWCEAFARGQVEVPKGRNLPVSDAENT